MSINSFHQGHTGRWMLAVVLHSRFSSILLSFFALFCLLCCFAFVLCDACFRKSLIELLRLPMLLIS